MKALAIKYYSKKRVFITGGAGFIGSHLVDALVRAGARVTVLVRTATDLWRLKEMRGQIDIVRCDLSNEARLRRVIKNAKPKIIFHLAAFLDKKADRKTFDTALQENFLNTLNILRAADAAGTTERFVHVGTIDEYGANHTPFTETMREEPSRPYAATKVMATHAVLAFSKVSGMPVVVVRPAACFGPKQGSGMLIPNVIRHCLEKKDFPMNKGEQVRDLIFVDDLVDGMLLSGYTKGASGHIINFGTERPHTVKDVANMVVQLMGNPITIRFGAEPYRKEDPMKFFMSSKKAKKLLGWRARADFDGAFKKTIAWYKN